MGLLASQSGQSVSSKFSERLSQKAAEEDTMSQACCHIHISSVLRNLMQEDRTWKTAGAIGRPTLAEGRETREVDKG